MGGSLGKMSTERKTGLGPTSVRGLAVVEMSVREGGSCVSALFASILVVLNKNIYCEAFLPLLKSGYAEATLQVA
jgi:hypothetical protein